MIPDSAPSYSDDEHIEKPSIQRQKKFTVLLYVLAAAMGIMVLVIWVDPPMTLVTKSVILVFAAAFGLLLRGLGNELRKSRLLVTHTREMAWEMDGHFSFVLTAGAVAGLTGYDPEFLKSKPLSMILAPEDQKLFQAGIEKSSFFSMETRILNGPGVEIWGKQVGKKGGKIQYQGGIRDITSYKELEKELELAKENLFKARKMENLGVLAGSVAHDLNNILSGIATYPEVLLMDRELTEKTRQGLVMIRDSGKKASAVVSDLLTISRGASTKMQPVNLNIIISRYMAAPDFGKILQGHSLPVIDVETEPELLNIQGSYIHIEKALVNLVLNAVEETGSKPGARVGVKTENFYVDDPRGEGFLPSGEYVLLRVSDNGAGISEELKSRIFDPFFTSKEMGKSGTGLGLTLVWNTVKAHGGHIRVLSDEGGSRFELYFPAVRDGLASMDDPGSMEQIRGSGEQILIVDDLANQRNIAGTILKNLGYKVFSMADGEDAVEFIKGNPVDLLVLDMVMEPSISGLETYHRIKKIYPDQKAIIASGHSESDDVLKAQDLGAGSFVKKPYTVLEMGIAVKEELERK